MTTSKYISSSKFKKKYTFFVMEIKLSPAFFRIDKSNNFFDFFWSWQDYTLCINPFFVIKIAIIIKFVSKFIFEKSLSCGMPVSRSIFKTFFGNYISISSPFAFTLIIKMNRLNKLQSLVNFISRCLFTLSFLSHKIAKNSFEVFNYILH